MPERGWRRVGVQSDHVASEPSEHDREHRRYTAIGVVDDDLEFAPLDIFLADLGKERLRVLFEGPGREFDLANLFHIGQAIVLAEVDRLDLTLGVLVQVDALLVEELDQGVARMVRIDANVHAALRRIRADGKARERQGIASRSRTLQPTDTARRECRA